MSNPAANRVFRPTIVAAVVCGLVAAALFQFFGSANRGYVNTPSLFWWWISQWLDPGAEAGHGWLILGMSGWLWWRNLQIADRGLRIADSLNPQSAIRNPQCVESPLPAFAAMLAALAFHALGFAAQQARVSIVALLLFTWGLLRLAGGPRWGRAALFPLGFMVFAIPINMLDSAGFWLRVWVVKASAAIAHSAGIDVLQSGTQLVAPDGRYNYDVAAACSGIRSLTAMTALSLLAGYFNFHAWWRRALILLLCFPLVYLGNVARIVAIIFAAQWGGPKWGDIAHEVMGYGIFVIVLGGTLGAAGAMRRWWPEESGDGKPGAGKREEAAGRDAGEIVRQTTGKSTGSILIVAVVAGLAIGEMFFLRALANSPARGNVGVLLAPDGRNPVELPAFVGTEWIGRRAEVSAIEREVLPPDTGYSRKTYVSLADPRQQVFLSIVLSGRDRTSIHRPELCLVGQGWTIASREERRFTYPARPGANFDATLLHVRRELQTTRGKETVPQLTAYWFVGADAVAPSHWRMVVRDAWNRVVHARADRWAYVLMQTDARDGEAAALARMQTVLDATLPAFQQVFAAQKP